MDTRNWLKGNVSAALQAMANDKIRVLQSFENELPAVFIVHDLVTQSVVYMSRKGLELLGITLEEVRLNMQEYHTIFFNEEDAAHYAPKILDLVATNKDGDMVSFFQQVRTSTTQPWEWYLSSTKIFLRDESGTPRLIITLSVRVDAEHPISVKVDKLLEENKFLRKQQHIFSLLTKREKEILKMMAIGHSSSEIANKLHISEATANTHRRNIRSKINAETQYDVTRFAQAFDLI